MGPLIKDNLVREMRRAEMRAARGIRDVRTELDNIARFVDDPSIDGFDNACNVARQLGEVLVECSRIAAFRLVLALDG